MKAYFVQHASALSEDEDPKRPLSETGRKEAKATAKFAKSAGVTLGRIWHSGKNRAAETAEILADQLKPALGVRSSEELGPIDDVRDWAGRLVEMDHDVMLVGHLPYMERITSMLLVGDQDRKIIECHNAGIICLEYKADQWVVRWIVTPDLLR